MSFHHPHLPRLHPLPAVDQALDRVGDLELVTPRRLDRLRGREHRRAEHVHADEGEVARRILRLLHEPDDALAVELHDPELGRVGHSGEEDQRVGLRVAEGVDEIADPVAEQVVAEVHHERRLGEEFLAVSTAGEPARLVLDDVGDPRAERRAVACRLADLVARLGCDHDPDLGHACRTSASIP